MACQYYLTSRDSSDFFLGHLHKRILDIASGKLTSGRPPVPSPWNNNNNQKLIIKKKEIGPKEFPFLLVFFSFSFLLLIFEKIIRNVGADQKEKLVCCLCLSCTSSAVAAAIVYNMGLSPAR